MYGTAKQSGHKRNAKPRCDEPCRTVPREAPARSRPVNEPSEQIVRKGQLKVGALVEADITAAVPAGLDSRASLTAEARPLAHSTGPSQPNPPPQQGPLPTRPPGTPPTRCPPAPAPHPFRSRNGLSRPGIASSARARPSGSPMS
jgi:hypothetical protein